MQDEQRARRELTVGHKVKIFSSYENNWFTGEVQQTIYPDKIKIMYSTHVEEDQISVEERNSEKIIPIYDKNRKCFLPAPKKEFKVKKKTNSTKKKRKKKPTVKKISSRTEIIDKIASILTHLGSLPITTLLNHLKDFLTGGSWNQTKYKKQYGAFSKFLKSCPEFVVEDGKVSLPREPTPEPEPAEIQKEEGKNESSGVGLIFIILFLIIPLAIGFYLSHENDHIWLKEVIVEVKKVLNSKFPQLKEFW